jgi:hypothetical protein
VGAYHSSCIPLAAGYPAYRAVQVDEEPRNVSFVRSNVVCGMSISRTRRNLFSTLSQTGSSFIPLRSTERADYLHTYRITGALLAEMLFPSKGDGGTPSSKIPGSDSPEMASAPIGNLGESHLSTPSFRHEDRSWDDQLKCPASPKKRKTDTNSAINVPDEALLQAVEYVVAKAMRRFTEPTASGGSLQDLQSLRSEMNDNINKVHMQLTQLVNTAMMKMQAEVNKRAVEVLPKLEQMHSGTPMQDKGGAVPSFRGNSTPGSATQEPVRQRQDQSKRVAQPTWAGITGAGGHASMSWTTVTNGKKKLKKHPLDQRRILLTRDSQSHDCDSRDVMFEVNKALAHARAHVTVRLIKLRYTEKGNLSGMMRENICAEELLAHAAIVMTAVQKLDPAVVSMEKKERWRKLRVHGVALDRYMGEGGLDVAREEIEVMTGEKLPHAPQWIKTETLNEMGASNGPL